MFFGHSSFALRHLKLRRLTMNITRGLESVGNTRFSTLYFSGTSVSRNLPPIKAIVEDGTVPLKTRDQARVADS